MKDHSRFLAATVKLVGRDELSTKSQEVYDALKAAGKGEDLKWFKGYANTPTKDRDKELILNEAHVRAIPKHLAGTPAITLGHEFDAARAVNIGRTTNAFVDAEGLGIEGYIGTNSKAQDIRTNLDEGVPVDFSLAFMDATRRDPTADERAAYGEDLRKVVTDYEWLNTGAVNIGSNRNSHMSAKSRRAAAPDAAEEASEAVDMGMLAQNMSKAMDLFGQAMQLLADCADMLQSTAQPEPADPNGEQTDPTNTPEGQRAVAKAEQILKDILNGLKPVSPNTPPAGER